MEAGRTPGAAAPEKAQKKLRNQMEEKETQMEVTICAWTVFSREEDERCNLTYVWTCSLREVQRSTPKGSAEEHPCTELID